MRRFVLLVCALGLGFAAPNPQLKAVKKIYLLNMSSSLDQYLANRLTQTGTFQVVTDPQKADAIFTETIGEGFEQKMAALYPSPEKAEEDEDSDDQGKDKDKDKDKAKDQDKGGDKGPEPGMGPGPGPGKDKDKDKDKDGGIPTKPVQRFASFSKGRGTVYIVDRESRNVVWSTYWPIKGSRPEETNRRAERIVETLRKDLRAK